MDAFDFQTQLRNFTNYPVELGPYYTILGIYEELGILSEKLRTSLKDKEGKFTDRDIQRLQISIGDIIYYLTCMCTDIGANINDVLALCIKKQTLMKEQRLKTQLEENNIKHV